MSKYLALILLIFLTFCSGIKNNLDFANKCASEGLWEEAVFRWKNALKNNPKSPILYNNLAIAYERMGEFQGAKAAYEKALSLAPDNKQIKSNFEKFNNRKKNDENTRNHEKK